MTAYCSESGEWAEGAEAAEAKATCGELDTANQEGLDSWSPYSLVNVALANEVEGKDVQHPSIFLTTLPMYWGSLPR